MNLENRLAKLEAQLPRPDHDDIRDIPEEFQAEILAILKKGHGYFDENSGEWNLHQLTDEQLDQLEKIYIELKI